MSQFRHKHRPHSEAEASALARPYDFRQPRLFSQDQMRGLARVHDTFARDFSIYLSTQLRGIVDLNSETPQQMRYSQFVGSCADPTALYKMAAYPHEKYLLLEMEPSFVIFLVERLFGGEGTWSEAQRPISQIEQGIMAKALGRIFDDLETAWRPITNVHFAEAGFEASADLVQIASPSEVVFVVPYRISLFGRETTIRFCYPYRLLEQTLSRTGRQHWGEDQAVPLPTAERQRFEEMLHDVGTELRAVLGKAYLTLDEISTLRMGDVIPLEQKTSDPLDVYLNTQPRFRAAVGRSGSRCALRILDVIEANQDFNERD